LFMARERHLVALREALEFLTTARDQQAFELKAEDLRLSQAALGRITGEVSADDLLGEIFGRFCIGK
ncbi:MAG TPA: tRNA uridine-5-carboxymethylaminomethyl(34) synthesis GTPase MnmE, partial [Ramlibacter sp.]